MPLPDIDPSQPAPVPPLADPAAEEVKREAVEQARRSGGEGLDYVGDGLEAVAEIGGPLVEAGAEVGAAVAETAAGAVTEVGAEVLAGAFEALGSGFEVAGGCAEGCSVMIAFVVLLATAGSALAYALW